MRAKNVYAETTSFAVPQSVPNSDSDPVEDADFARLSHIPRLINNPWTIIVPFS